METDKLFQANRASTIRMKQLVDGLSDRQLVALLPNGWSVSVTLAHLAFWDQRVIQVIAKASVEGKVTPSNFDDSLNDILEPFLSAIPVNIAVKMAIDTSVHLDQLLEEVKPELLEQLEAVNHRWVDRSLHRNDHLDEIENFINQQSS
ncbi:hypothetical protein EG832_04355 [bacterium]|nr:hypothetical protein [bacterium]